MNTWRSEPYPRDEGLAARASPEPRMPTAKEKQHIADVHRQAEKDRAAMRAAGFGDHKGTQGT